MTLALTILSACVLALMLNYRGRFLLAITQRDAAEVKACKALDEAKQSDEASGYWQRACRASYRLDPALEKLTDAQVAKLYQGLKRGFPDERPADFHVGTPANPILTPNGDSARWSSLSDLMTGGKP